MDSVKFSFSPLKCQTSYTARNKLLHCAPIQPYVQETTFQKTSIIWNFSTNQDDWWSQLGLSSSAHYVMGGKDGVQSPTPQEASPPPPPPQQQSLERETRNIGS